MAIRANRASPTLTVRHHPGDEDQPASVQVTGPEPSPRHDAYRRRDQEREHEPKEEE